MLPNNLSQENFLMRLEVALNVDYTDEQKELITNFGKGPVFCFASPGTGKTFTAIGGLLTAELFNGVPGNDIYALSFTKLATGELTSRYTRACNKLRVSKTVNFATLHSLCRTILMQNYTKLGMMRFNTSEPLSMSKAFDLISESIKERNILLNPNQIRNIVAACNTLNASLVFDRDVVESKMVFKLCNTDYDTFTDIRGLLFSYSLLTEKISVSDLLLFTVLLLTRYPEVSEEFKNNCKLMLVDEAQDLSLLQLRIISLLTDNPVLIGDMKQQIYGFNGACHEVVREFHKLYSNSKDLKLTQSFRCKNEIAEYATKIIIPNNIGGEDYKGTGEGGSVNIIQGLYKNGADIKGLCEKLHKEYVVNNKVFSKQYLFLTRTNISLVPIVEELYKQGLPFRVNKYTPAYDIPLIKELCELLKLADQPHILGNIPALRYIIPEFRNYRESTENPLYKICKKTGSSIFEVNYQFNNIGLASKAMQLLIDVKEMIDSGSTVDKLFNKLWHMFSENWVSYVEWRLEAKPQYYIDSVKELTRKSFAMFIQDEIKKLDIIKDCNMRERGIRCYTMHASKGLEADIVYILDADEGLIPNTSKINQMLQKDCTLDAARAIREERALCYVACTRAKEELNIVYNSEPANMLLGSNVYGQLDDTYRYYNNNTEDIKAFEAFTERFVK